MSYLIAFLALISITFKKVGGIYHWRVGRLGGSFYLASKRKPKPMFKKWTPRDAVIAKLGWFRGSLYRFGIDKNITPMETIEAMKFRARMFDATRQYRAATLLRDMAASAELRNDVARGA